MQYKYQAFGIPVYSTIELPGLLILNDVVFANPIFVEIGQVKESLENPPNVIKPFSKYNEREFRFEMPDVGTYYVSDGSRILIQPETENIQRVLLYFYSNCLAAILFQRNLIPFHVSGVFIDSNRVLLFAAPPRTGKSTLALKLQELGYSVFTDDTAVLNYDDRKVYATASYPMMRFWQTTLDNQKYLDEKDKQFLYAEAEIEKYAYPFHENFVHRKVEVAGIVFLEETGKNINIEPLQPSVSLKLLGNNIYRRQWITGMKKQKIQFEQLTKICQNLKMYKANRPKGIQSYDTFAEAIENQIIKTLNV